MVSGPGERLEELRSREAEISPGPLEDAYAAREMVEPCFQAGAEANNNPHLQ